MTTECDEMLQDYRSPVPRQVSIDSLIAINAVVYAGSKCCLSLDMCTAFAKPCEYARRRQMSR